MKIKMEHSGIKPRHKYFGPGRITLTFGVFACVALVCVSMLSSTASCENKLDRLIDTLNNQISNFEDRVEALAVRIQESASAGITAAQDEIISNTDAAETAILENTDAAEESINQFIRDTHLVDPFDVAVNICAEIAGGAAIEGTAGFGVPVTLEGTLGIDFFGNGATIFIEPNGKIGVGIGLNAGVGMSVTACINGVFARQTPDPEEEAAVIASVPTDEQVFITGLFELGNSFRNRIKDTAEATKLVVVGSDRLNSSLGAFAGVTALNAQRLGQFIVSKFDGTDPSSPLGTLVGDLSNSGNGIDRVLSDLAGVGDLTSSAFSDINNSIADGISTLGLGIGGAGLSGLVDLSGVETAFNTFEDIDEAVDNVRSLVDSLSGAFSDALDAAEEAAQALANCLASAPLFNNC